MTEQPEALRLADALRDGVPYDEAEIENELRRLHAENQRCRNVCDATSEGWRVDAEEWKAQRDALLGALRALVHEGRENYVALDRGIGTETDAGKRWLNARAAIKKAEEA